MASIFQGLGLVQFIVLLCYPKLGSDIMNTGLDFVSAGISSLFMNAPIKWLSLVGFVYCIVLAGLIIKTGFQFYQLTALIKTANFSESDKYTSFINSLPNCSSSRKVKLGISSTIETPISLGWIEPIILLPIALVNQLNIKEIESIILHEWAHILRNDYLLNLMTSFVQVVLFFNPFVYLFNKEISLQREIACDSFVLTASVEKLDYLNTLYKMATAISAKDAAIQNTNKWTMGFLNMPNELLYRVKILTKTKRFNFIQSTKIIFSTILASLLFFIPFDKKQNKLVTKVQPKVSFASTLVSSNKEINKPTIIQSTDSYTTIRKQSRVRQKQSDENTAVVNTSYDEMVQKTISWIKSREVESQFASYQENIEAVEFEVAEKLLMRAIFTNYQLKRELLNDRLTKATNEKEAMDYVVNSKEWEQMQQYEKWTAEFLKKHPLPVDTTTSFSTLKARLIVY
jgi:beta-lactamase regulating signal transducer with metallopeptidase domain